jgi:hypothetical protein
MEGLKQLVNDREHRQEIVANGLSSYLSRGTSEVCDAFIVTYRYMVLLSDFFKLSNHLGDRASEFWSHFLLYQRKVNHTIHLLKWFTGELPEVSNDSWLAHSPFIHRFPRLPLY